MVWRFGKGLAAIRDSFSLSYPKIKRGVLPDLEDRVFFENALVSKG